MSNNLNLPQVTASQGQKDVTINEQVSILDAAVTEVLALAGNTPTVSNDQYRENIVLRMDGSQTAAASFTVPAIKKLICIDNVASSEQLTVTRGTTDVILAAGKTQILYTDGTANGLVSFAVAAPSQAVSFYAEGTIATDEIIGVSVIADPLTLPAGLSGSQAYAITASTGAYSFDILKNESTVVGTVDFAAATNAGTFTFASQQSFAAGDRLSLRGETTPDASLADVSITFVGS